MRPPGRLRVRPKADDHHAGKAPTARARAEAPLSLDAVQHAETVQHPETVARLQAASGNRTLARLVDGGRPLAPSPARAALPGGRSVQRHASWEHKMLGDVDPGVLEVIAAGRDVAATEKENVKRRKKNQLEKTVSDEDGNAISLDNVLHTIDQEIRRLKYFKTSPPTGTIAEATKQLQISDRDDRMDQVLDSDMDVNQKVNALLGVLRSQWDVRLVSVPLKDGTSFIVTYGEMNTLADFYGSRDEMAKTPAANFRGIIGGIREESYRKFMRLRNELTPGKDKLYNPDAGEHSFAGAIGNKGTAPPTGLGAFITNDQYGELKLMGEMGNEERAKIDGREETSYVAGLARNACHFAPYSWHAWGTGHEKAVVLAKQAATLRAEVAKLQDQNRSMKERMQDTPGRAKAIEYNQNLINEKEAEAERLQNEALIENGFADHFLQDSYAAGHLIDKTKIMQWFAQWLDKHKGKRDYSTEEQWRRIQQIAYGEKGIGGDDLYDTSTVGQQRSNDPQSVENIGGDDWEQRFDALGLKVPPSLERYGKHSFTLLTWWQEQAGTGKLLKTDSKELLEKGPIKNLTTLKNVLRRLVDDGVVYYNWYSTGDRGKGSEEIGIGTKSLRLKTEYVPTDLPAFRHAVSEANAGRTGEYNKMAKAVTYGDYHNFLNHGYLQLSSNVLHDHFCANGLDVAMKAGDTPYRIYGDNAMLGRESSKMVKYSATTSHMSRDAIYDLAATGVTTKITSSIADRFPTYVRPVGTGQNLSIEDWHQEGGSLHTLCFKKIFPEAAALFSKSTVAAKAKLAVQVSKDAIPQIHSGEAF